jgi:hypothetical protein
MSNDFTAKPMTTANTGHRIHFKAYAQDNVNNPSQIADTNPTLVLGTVGNPSVLSVAIDPSDPSAIIITPKAPGTTQFNVDVTPALPAGKAVTVHQTIAAPPPDSRHLDVLTDDDPF